MTTTQEPRPLAPLGATDTYAYTNGVMAWYSPGFVHIVASVDDHVLTIPRQHAATIKAVAVSYGLSDTEAALLVEAIESYAR